VALHYHQAVAGEILGGYVPRFAAAFALPEWIDRLVPKATPRKR